MTKTKRIPTMMVSATLVLATGVTVAHRNTYEGPAAQSALSAG